MGTRAAAAGSRERLFGFHPVLEALRAGRRRVYRLLVRSGPQRAPLRAAVEEARDRGVPVEEVAGERLSAGLPAGAQAQGLVLEVGALPQVTLAELLAAPDPATTLVALDRIEDPQNVGAIARTAEAAGASGLILTRHHAPPLGPSVSRASAGAIEWLPTCRVPNLVRALKLSKEKGFWVLGADLQAALDPYRTELHGPRVLVLGGEGTGLRPSTRAALDLALRIPTEGRVESLNVSAAAAALLFELRRRDRLATSP